MIVECENCKKGNTIPDQPKTNGYYVCGVCQSVLDVGRTGSESYSSANEFLRCPRCKRSQEPGAIYCHNCGIRLDDERVSSSFFEGDPRFQSLSRHAICVQIMLTFWLIVAAVAVIISLAEIMELRRVISGTSISQTNIVEIEQVQIVVDTLNGIGLATTSITFFFWIFRASRNLQPLRVSDQRFSPRWSVIWWFVPFMWFFRPYQVVKEIWQRSDPNLEFDSSTATKDLPGSPLLKWWWSAWLIGWFLGDYWIDSAFLVSIGQDDVWRVFFRLLGYVSIIASCLFLFIVIRRISSRQNQKYLRVLESSA